MDWVRDEEVTRRKVILLDQEKTQCVHPVDGRILKINEVDKADFLCDYSQVRQKIQYQLQQVKFKKLIFVGFLS